MKYMGSKARIVHEILPIMLDKEHDTFVDAFCGGCSVIENVPDTYRRIANDKNRYLIEMWKALQAGTKFKEEIPRELYADARDCYHGKNGRYTDAAVGWIGFMASFNGRFFDGGYSGHNVVGKNGKARDYIREQIENTMRDVPLLKGVQFINYDYKELNDYIPAKSIIYCFDKETEILTIDGWKNVSDVKMGELCLSREPNTGVLEYVDVVRLISYHYKGKMYKYNGKNVDLCVTPNHRLFTNHIHGRNKNVANDEFHEASEIFDKISKNRFVSAGGKWVGDNLDTIEICGRVFDKGDFAYLLGLFLTDGSVNNKGGITLSQQKPNIIKKIESVLKRLGIEHSVYNVKRSNNAKCYYICRKYLPFFKQFYIKENRRIPKEFKNWDASYLERLLEGLLDGDSDNERRKIINSAKGLLDDVQEICYKVGLSANIRKQNPRKSFLKSENRWINAKKPWYILSINHKPYLSIIKDNQKMIDYDDMVNCVTLSKWHTVLVKRHGKPIWCGQCDIPYAQTKKYDVSKNFDYESFYIWCMEMARRGHKVFISEYQMPQEFRCVWEKEVTNSLNPNITKRPVERLFTID